MKITCPVITVKREGRLWFISDDTTPIIGRGISREAAFKCYFRGLNLLQQKYAGIDTGINNYLDYLEQENVKKQKKQTFKR